MRKNQQTQCGIYSAPFSFIVVPQLINDYFLQNTTNISSRAVMMGVEQIEDSMNFFDFFTGQVSLHKMIDQNYHKNL